MNTNRGRREWSRRPMVGADSLDPPLTARRSGTARWCNCVLIGIGGGSGGSVAVRVGCVRLAAVGAAVLSGAAADPDRGDGLEPLGGADRGGRRRRPASPPFSADSSSSPSWSAIGLPAWWLGYLALLARPAPAPSPAARMVSGRPSGVLGRDHRRGRRDRRDADLGSDLEASAPALRSGLERMLNAPGARAIRPAGHRARRPSRAG